MPTQSRTIKDIQSDLRAFDAAARRDSSPAALIASWRRVFGGATPPLSASAAKGFSQYYKTMTRAKKQTTRRKQRGGAAPLDYVMTSGMPLATWGQFPVEVDTDPGSIKDLDVYFHDSLPLSPPGYWPNVPADMGSNKFMASGGTRQQRGGMIRSSIDLDKGKTIYGYNPSVNTIYRYIITYIDNVKLTVDDTMDLELIDVLNNPNFDTQLSELRARFPTATYVANGGKRRRGRTTRRRRTQRGGNLLESLAMRPIFTATAPPNVAQIAANAWAGSPAAIPTPASAVQYTWSPASAAGAPIDPGRITEIGSDFARLAAPAPWASTLPSAPGAATGR